MKGPLDAIRAHDRSPAGAVVRRPGRPREAGRGERLRGLLPVRPLRELPGPAGHPTTDAWTVIAGLARDTDRIGLGVLVSPVTFRHPGSFAKVVTTADEMSGGRVEVGVGAGWNDLEHAELGLPLPADQGAGRPDGGAAPDPARPVGRAGRLDLRGSERDGHRLEVLPEAGRRCRAGRSWRRASCGRGSSWVAVGRPGACASRPAGRTSSTRARSGRTGSARSTRSWTRRAWRSGATRPRWLAPR